jgi:hypothetical protein
MAFRFSIGVVTYLGRFETYFKSLLRQLNFIFPDYDIIVFLNGHHNLDKQIDYLQKATSLLVQYPRVRYLTNISHQPLARAWNWLILMAACEHILILNDDVTLNLEFRHNLEKLDSVPQICTINKSWSHFLISKEVVKQVGWFDEGLAGMGYEDYDYIFRLARRGIMVKNLAVHGVLSYIAPSTDASWAAISEVVAGKYSKVNYDYFMKKWSWSEYGEVPASKAFKVLYEPYGQEWLVSLHEPLSPREDCYPRESLRYRAPPARGIPLSIKGIAAQMLSFINSSYWSCRLALAAYLRRMGLLGAWWEKLKARFKR